MVLIYWDLFGIIVPFLEFIVILWLDKTDRVFKVMVHLLFDKLYTVPFQWSYWISFYEVDSVFFVKIRAYPYF